MALKLSNINSSDTPSGCNSFSLLTPLSWPQKEISTKNRLRHPITQTAQAAHEHLRHDMLRFNNLLKQDQQAARFGFCPGGGREGLQCPVALIHAWRALQLTGMPLLSWLQLPALILLAPKLCPALDVNLILLGANGVRNLTHLFLLCRWEPYGS